MAFWDDYLNNQYSGSALDAARNAAIGQKPKPTVTSGNKAWQDAQSNFPAVNQMNNLKNTAFARNAPINTPQQNFADQIPVGGFGLGLGYGSRQPDIGNFMNQGGQQEPTLSGYHWFAPTGGVSGGNNAWSRYYWSNGTATTGPANSQYNTPQIGLPMSAQPAIGAVPKTQYTLPGVNAPVNALSDPSVGALDNARRSMNQYGQNVINPAGGGQIISGQGPSFGALYGSTISTNTKGQQVLNTPSGGQAIGGPSSRKPPMLTGNGQIWNWGGWY